MFQAFGIQVLGLPLPTRESITSVGSIPADTPSPVLDEPALSPELQAHHLGQLKSIIDVKATCTQTLKHTNTQTRRHIRTQTHTHTTDTYTHRHTHRWLRLVRISRWFSRRLIPLSLPCLFEFITCRFFRLFAHCCYALWTPNLTHPEKEIRSC